MEALKRTFDQFLDLFRTLPPSQRGTLIVLPLVVVAAFGILMFRDSSSSNVPLSWGKTFTTDELGSAEQTLRDAGLDEFRREGQRILVPRKELDRYNAALLEGGSLPAGWAAELEKQTAKEGWGSTVRKSQTQRDIALSKGLKLMIRAAPDIHDAEVIMARTEQRSFHRNGPNVTATVSVRPRNGRELSMLRVRSLREAVAAAVPGLQTKDVVIFDQIQGKAYTPEKEDDPFNSRILERINEFTQLYQRRISEQLDYISGVVVTVNVDLDNLKSSVERTQTVDPEKTVSTLITEQTSEKTANQSRSRSEPGFKANQGKDLQTSGGNEQQQSTNETNTTTVNVPGLSFETKEIIGAMPKAVHVAVQIPESYYRGVVAIKEGLTEGETEQSKKEFREAVDAALEAQKQQINQDVRTTVAKAIPATADTNDAITVGSYIPIRTATEPVDVPLTETLGTAVSQWGGAVGLALFALWALRLLNRSMPKGTENEPTESPTLTMHDTEEDEQDVEVPKIPVNSERDEIQAVVRDNPEMAAAVLGKWIQVSK
jgi:flagellar M-ring protein FliF